MEATITMRAGEDDPNIQAIIRNNPPLKAPTFWITRELAAEQLDVGIRTIDRYLRRRLLTGYRGPVPEGGTGVRVWEEDVELWDERLDITVVSE